MKGILFVLVCVLTVSTQSAESSVQLNCSRQGSSGYILVVDPVSAEVSTERFRGIDLDRPQIYSFVRETSTNLIFETTFQGVPYLNNFMANRFSIPKSLMTNNQTKGTKKVAVQDAHGVYQLDCYVERPLGYGGH